METRKILSTALVFAFVGLMLPSAMGAAQLERGQDHERMMDLKEPIILSLDEGPDGTVTGVVVARSLEECTESAQETCEDGVATLDHDSGLWGIGETCEYTCK